MSGSRKRGNSFTFSLSGAVCCFCLFRTIARQNWSMCCRRAETPNTPGVANQFWLESAEPKTLLRNSRFSVIVEKEDKGLGLLFSVFPLLGGGQVMFTADWDCRVSLTPFQRGLNSQVSHCSVPGTCAPTRRQKGTFSPAFWCWSNEE